jgi:hypothetical protein
MEAIYNSLLDDDFFITLTNRLSGLIDTLGTIIDTFGGFKGIILLIGTIFMRVF